MKTLSLIALSILLVSSADLALAQSASKTSNRNDASAATETASAATRIRPTNSETYPANPSEVEAQRNYDIALAFYTSGRFDDAAAALREAVRLRPNDAQTHYLLGMIHTQARNYKEAADALKRATRFKPSWAEAHFRLGVVSSLVGRHNQTVESYKHLLDLGSPLANVLWRVVNDETRAASMVADLGERTPPGSKMPDGVPVSAPAVSSAQGERQTGGSPIAEKVAPTSADEPKPTDDANLTAIYRIGVGDILDIRLINSRPSRSTLYTVIEGGIIDMPVAGGAVSVTGLTVEEVQSRIAAELKRRAVEVDAQVSVSVRQYASHTIIVSGSVVNSGTKILRREAVPLYVIMAEAQPRLDAARVVIMRASSPPQTIELSDSNSMNLLIRPGDVLNVSARPQEYYYIAGRVNYPGQKNYQPGITLLQAILAAGGVVRPGDAIELSREDEKGMLNTTKLSLKEIKSGKVQDPKLQPGDRIEVVN
jgi:protein involved in polysaccharide export with SLBB domain